MNEEVVNLRMMVDSQSKKIEKLIYERETLRGTVGELLVQHQKDIDRISELLIENIELHNKLKGLA